MAGDGGLAQHHVYSSDCFDPGTVEKVTSSAISLIIVILPGGVYELNKCDGR
jgi:hypothetical protein